MEKLTTTFQIINFESLNYDDVLRSISIYLAAKIEESAQDFESPPFEYLLNDQQFFSFSCPEENDIPSEETIKNYLHFLSNSTKFGMGSWILTLAYLKKISSKIPILWSNLQKLVLCSLYNSQKINEKISLKRLEFIKNISNLRLIDFIFMNMEFQDAIGYNYEVSKSELMMITELILRNIKQNPEIEWRIDTEFIDKIEKKSKGSFNINEMEADVHPSKRIHNINMI